MSIFWIIISYILGSIPFGYIISKVSGKNILEIGWRKTSGSNVYRNVGKLQGALTGSLDFAKGFLAVFLAEEMNLPLETQVLSGTAVVLGHNWSLFLRFAGGRGIGTFVGALAALSLEMFGLVLIPLVIFSIVWNAAVGTLIAFAFLIYISFYPFKFLDPEEVETAGVMAIFTLFPVLIKRLSPLKEIFKAKNKPSLVKNRLLFDNDDSLFDLRIKKIIKKSEENLQYGKMASFKAAKQGALAAKNGVKAATNGFKKYLFGEPEKVVTEIKAGDFKKMMIAAAKKVVLEQEEINRINVFPVADKDTGYNLAATLLGIEGTLSQKEYNDFRELAGDMKEAVMINARGNVGMISTGYFIEFLDRIKHLESIDAFHFAFAMERGIKAARDSIFEPVDGTILDIIEAAGKRAGGLSKEKEKNIVRILDEACRAGRNALKETPEKLKVLKDNNVVDAGGLGFLKIMEGWLDSLKGVVFLDKPETVFIQPKAEEELKSRYEVAAFFKKAENINFEDFKRELSLLGDSLELVVSEDKVKFHIHTNQPEAVRERIRDFPELDLRVEDMQGEMFKKEPLGLIVDSVADLPQEFLERNKVIEVPFYTRFKNGEIVASKEDIYPKMKKVSDKGLPITSAPSFKEFAAAYQKGLQKFDKVLVITLSSKLSGAYSSARIARSTFKKLEKVNIYVFDSFTVEVAEGLICFKAQELISQNKTLEETVEELRRFSPQVILLGVLEEFRYVVHGGRIRLPRFLLSPADFVQKMGIHPLIKLKDGKIALSGVRFGKDVPRVLAKEAKSFYKGKKLKVAIAHANNFEGARRLKEELEKNGEAEVLFVSSVSAVIGTHTGSGALLVAFYPFDVIR